MKRMVGCSALAVMFIALLMAGCGGGGGSSAPPRLSPPASVFAAGGIGEVTVTWTAATGATSYNIYHSTSPNVKKGTGTKVTGAISPHSVTGLAIGTKYYFVVTTADAAGESAESVEVSATPVFPAPTGVKASPGNNSATIQWEPVAGATSYTVYHSPTPGVTKTTPTNIPGAASPQIVTGLTNGTPHYFVVTAGANGLESTESVEVSTTPTSVLPPVPSAPTGVTGTAGAGSARITWPAVDNATSYNIYYSTSPGVTTATQTKVTGATSPAIVPNLIRGVAYYFVVTAENAAGESGVSNEVSVTPNPPDPVFSQADLAGTWNVRVLRSAPTAGWYSVLIDVDNAGTVTVRESGASGANLTIPNVPALSVTSGTGVSAGVVKETGAGSNSTFHGKMSSGKNLIVGTSTQGTSIALHILVKRVPGITYSSADLANKSFGYQKIYSGSSHFWELAAGSTDGSGRITLASKEDSSGPLSLPAPNYATLSITGTGIVTIDNEITFSGVMSSDKNTIVGTSTDAAGKHSIRVIQMRGQNYQIADLAGENVAYAFHSLAASSWARATWSTDLSGHVTVLNILNSDGTTGLPDPWTHTIDAQGNVWDVANPEGSRGMLSYGKDLLVEVGDYFSGSSMVIKVQ
jgi:fibronectin type 3 domain-containing protein